MIFVDILTESKQNKTQKYWVELGVAFIKAKEKDKSLTSKAFAQAHNIPYGTLTKSFSRYSQAIKIAYEADKVKGKKSLSKREKEAVIINSFRQSINDSLRRGKKSAKDKSEKWFRETLKNGIKGHKVTRPTPGKLYAYVYDAKHKETLPYWDIYPLIIFLGTGTRGSSTLMYGLNLHYIPPKARQQFLEELLKRYSNTNTITNKTALKVDWSKVKGFQGSDKMIKSYLPNHIRGTLVEIKPSDWSNVVLMPLQQFVSKGKKYSATKVWSS